MVMPGITTPVPGDTNSEDALSKTDAEAFADTMAGEAGIAIPEKLDRAAAQAELRPDGEMPTIVQPQEVGRVSKEA
jgi:hypothetical protein